ncbi:hypothetical protein ACFL1E_02020 [Candidatus Omnitrophota bacterium]
MKKLLIVIVIAVLSNGCSTLLYHIGGGVPVSINYAYKDNDRSKPRITTGMTKEEVLSLWGAPESTASTKSAEDYGADAEWSYSVILKSWQDRYGKEEDEYIERSVYVCFGLYFKNGSLFKIEKRKYDSRIDL